MGNIKTPENPYGLYETKEELSDELSEQLVILEKARIALTKAWEVEENLDIERLRKIEEEAEEQWLILDAAALELLTISHSAGTLADKMEEEKNND